VEVEQQVFVPAGVEMASSEFEALYPVLKMNMTNMTNLNSSSSSSSLLSDSP